MQLKAFGFASREPQTAICRELELNHEAAPANVAAALFSLPLILSLHQLMHRPPRLQRPSVRLPKFPGSVGQASRNILNQNLDVRTLLDAMIFVGQRGFYCSTSLMFLKKPFQRARQAVDA